MAAAAAADCARENGWRVGSWHAKMGGVPWIVKVVGSTFGSRE